MSRARSFGRLPWPSVGARDPAFIPLTLPREKVRGWYWKVHFWEVAVNLTQFGGAYMDDTVLYFLDRTNNKEDAGSVRTPAGEVELPFGWSIDSEKPFGPGTSLLAVQLFGNRLADGDYGGAEYDADIESDISPFISISDSFGGTAQTTDPLETNVTCTIDGETLPYYAPAGILAGTIDMNPVAPYWPYELSAGGNAIYDVSDGHELMDPHQRDELPSDT